MKLLDDGVSALIDQARRLADPRSWPVQPRYRSDDRWYARLDRTDTYEAWLLTWLPGQCTEWHDHGGSAGVFTVVAGTLREDTLGASRHFGSGAARPFGERHVHRVVNDGPEPAISVHLYAPALTNMTRYELVGGALRVVAVEREDVNW